MVFLRELYYTVIVMRGSPLQNRIMKKFLLHLDKKVLIILEWRSIMTS